MVMWGNRLSSRAVPGADQAVMIGWRSHTLNTRPLTPAPMEIAQIHEVSICCDMPPACAAWMKMTSGPQYEMSTARKPATQALMEKSSRRMAEARDGSCGINRGECRVP